MKELCRDDLIGRNSGHTFTETVTGDMVLVEFKNSSGTMIARANKMSLDEAYDSIREQMGLFDELPVLTTAELALITPSEGTVVINGTTTALSFYLRGSWR